MINLLSRHHQKELLREYLMRIAVIAFFNLALVACILVVLLIPTYMRLNTEFGRLTKEQEAKQNLLSTDDQDQALAKAFTAKVNVLKDKNATSSVVDLTQRVLSEKSSGIVLTDFIYEGSDPRNRTLQIRGKADTREDLTQLKSALEADPLFANVDLPPQTLIKRSDIPFAIQLTLRGDTTAPAAVPPARPRSDTGADLLP